MGTLALGGRTHDGGRPLLADGGDSVAGLIALAVVLVKRLRPSDGRRTELERLARSDALSVALVFVVGYAGLMSSKNGGDGFTFPLAALLPALAVLALRRFPAAFKPAVAALVLVATVNLVSTSTIWAPASAPPGLTAWNQ